MISITVGTNTKRKQVVVDPNLTVRQVLEQNGVNYSVGNINLDAKILNQSDLDKTLTELGVTSGAYIINVAKAENAQ